MEENRKDIIYDAVDKDYIGHRGRLRDRARSGGIGGLADYEVLELLLQFSIPRQDTKPIAKRLIKEFGSLRKVFHAEEHRIAEIKGVGKNTDLLLSVVRRLTQEIAKEEITEKDKPIFSSWQVVADYCRSRIGFSGREKFAVMFLDSKNRLIADEILAEGTVNKVAAYPREIVRFAVRYDAAAVILVHNHPSGDTTPSKQDIEMTRNIARALKGVDIALHDHLIVSAKDETSFKNLGLLD